MRKFLMIAIVMLVGLPVRAFALTDEQPSKSEGFALYNQDMKFNPDKNADPNEQNTGNFKIGGMNFYVSGSGSYGPGDNTRPSTVQTGNQLFSPATEWQTRNFPH